jgi:hypothetical protein
MATLEPHFPAAHDARRQQHDGAGDVEGASPLSNPAVLEEVRKRIQSRGFVVVRGLLTGVEVDELKAEIVRDIAAWPADAKAHTSGPPPYVDFDPAVTAGELVPATKEQGVRRLFRLHSNNARFRALIDEERMQGPAKAVLGDELVLIQSMVRVSLPPSCLPVT